LEFYINETKIESVVVMKLNLYTAYIKFPTITQKMDVSLEKLREKQDIKNGKEPRRCVLQLPSIS
jgi:hypothetical protein